MAKTQTAPGYLSAEPVPFSGRLRRVLGRDWVLGWSLLLPILLVLAGLLAYPFATAISMSFQDRLLGTSGTWIGLANYSSLFGDKAALFLQAAWNTVFYTAAAVGLKFLIGMGMAAVVNQHILWRDFWRGLLFLPWAVPAIVAAFVWKFLYDDSGFFNTFVYETKLSNDFINFLADPVLAMPSLILVAVWTGTPFYTMNFLAGMQAIPEDMYEAAEIDGAGTFQRFWHITLPSLTNVILITTMLSAIWTSSNITQIYVLTQGGPQHVTATIPFLAYEIAIPGKQLGLGAAVSMLMVPAYVLLVVALTRQMLREQA